MAGLRRPDCGRPRGLTDSRTRGLKLGNEIQPSTVKATRGPRLLLACLFSDRRRVQPCLTEARRGSKPAPFSDRQTEWPCLAEKHEGQNPCSLVRSRVAEECSPASPKQDEGQNSPSYRVAGQNRANLSRPDQPDSAPAGQHTRHPEAHSARSHYVSVRSDSTTEPAQAGTTRTIKETRRWVFSTGQSHSSADTA